MTRISTVGFIGLGARGAPIAANLQQAGHALVVHDLRREAAEPHLQAGAVWAETPRALAEQSEVVFSCLPTDEATERVALGTDGLVAALRPGSAWFDLSTSTPALVEKLHAAVSRRGAHFLDAPVSGGVREARHATLSIWVGGDKAGGDGPRLGRARPALRHAAAAGAGGRPHPGGPAGDRRGSEPRSARAQRRQARRGRVMPAPRSVNRALAAFAERANPTASS